ncbi:MAG TPA: signal peptidase II [Solirubrobacterales bacterium]|nr:signal peptidase II [Solirubrobacterales bacterium]
MSVRRDWARALALIVAVVAFDQATKALLRAGVESGERVDLVLGFELVNVTNEGIAFGFLGDGGDLVMVVTLVALGLVLAWFALAPPRPGLWIAVGLLVGGALGNLVDRLRNDGVTDFLDPPLWPAFNLADVAITAGVVVLIWIAFQHERDQGAAP